MPRTNNIWPYVYTARCLGLLCYYLDAGNCTNHGFIASYEQDKMVAGDSKTFDLLFNAYDITNARKPLVSKG